MRRASYRMTSPKKITACNARMSAGVAAVWCSTVTSCIVPEAASNSLETVASTDHAKGA